MMNRFNEQLPVVTVKRLPDGQLRECRLHWLGPEDVAEIDRLQAEVSANMQPDEYFPQNVDELLDMFAGGGMAVGASVDGELIAFHSAVVPGASEENLGVDAALPDDALTQVVHLENCSVHPDYRGNGLQRLLAASLLDAMAVSGSFRYVCETVAPGNWPSIKSTLANDLWIVALKKKYGGYWRYVFVCDLNQPFRPDMSALVWVDGDDIPAQVEHFAAGRIAVAVASLHGRTMLGFTGNLPS